MRENLQFAGFVCDTWVGVSVAGLLARPSTPPIVIERVTAGRIAPTMEAVQSAIDAVEAQVPASQPNPAEQQAAEDAEFHALDDEIRNAQAVVLHRIMTTAQALATFQCRLTSEQFDAVLKLEALDRTLADVLIGYTTTPPQSFDAIPETVIQQLLPWAIRKHAAQDPPSG